LVSCSSGQPVGDGNLGRKRKLTDAKGRWLAPCVRAYALGKDTSKSPTSDVRVKGDVGERTHKDVVLRRRRDIQI